jgi:hypothetical protein
MIVKSELNIKINKSTAVGLLDITILKEDQFVNIFKCHESSQPNTNSAIKTAAKFCRRIKPSK